MGVIRQSFPIRAPAAHAFDVGTNLHLFRSFIPFLKDVRASDARIDHVGVAYTLVFGLLGLRFRTPSWRIEEVRPANLADSPRPDAPWEIVETGLLPGARGVRMRSTTRYEAAGERSIASHVVMFQLPGGLLGGVIDRLVVNPCVRLAMGIVGRRFARYAGSPSSRYGLTAEAPGRWP
jgi:hypothetical protein